MTDCVSTQNLMNPLTYLLAYTFGWHPSFPFRCGERETASTYAPNAVLIMSIA